MKRKSAAAVAEQHDVACAYCSRLPDKQNPAQWEHIVPVSRDGPDTPRNKVLTCRSCNLSKHNRLPSEWQKRLPPWLPAIPQYILDIEQDVVEKLGGGVPQRRRRVVVKTIVEPMSLEDAREMLAAENERDFQRRKNAFARAQLPCPKRKEDVLSVVAENARVVPVVYRLTDRPDIQFDAFWALRTSDDGTTWLIPSEQRSGPSTTAWVIARADSARDAWLVAVAAFWREMVHGSDYNDEERRVVQDPNRKSLYDATLSIGRMLSEWCPDYHHGATTFTPFAWFTPSGTCTSWSELLAAVCKHVAAELETHRVFVRMQRDDRRNPVRDWWIPEPVQPEP